MTMSNVMHYNPMTNRYVFTIHNRRFVVKANSEIQAIERARQIVFGENKS